MRRLRWIFWYHCQPVIRSIFRFLGFSRWQHCVDGSTGNVWCRASIDVSCKDQATFEKILHLINDFKDYFLSYGEPVYENPSPGNKAGGITTLEDKSLGCTQKSGTSAVVDVLKYGDKIRESGLSLLEGTGNDLVTASALASADCQLVLFTTGRGTPFVAFVPHEESCHQPRIIREETPLDGFQCRSVII